MLARRAEFRVWHDGSDAYYIMFQKVGNNIVSASSTETIVLEAHMCGLFAVACWQLRATA